LPCYFTFLPAARTRRVRRFSQKHLTIEPDLVNGNFLGFDTMGA
jgi:hypothetical protein